MARRTNTRDRTAWQGTASDAKKMDASRARGTVKLQPVDVAIIRCLHGDARSPIAQIAERLRMPESTVRHRLNRLVERGIVEFVALTNPFQFGYQIWVMVSVEVELAQIRSVANRLAALPEIYFVGITAGGQDLLAAGVFRSNTELVTFMTTRLARIPGIIRTSTTSILEVVKRTMTFGVPDGAVSAAGERQVRRSARQAR